MPMLRRQKFVPQKPPKDLRPDEEIFFFEPTNEIFRNYEDYFDRVILCNTLVWSCSITGKINLTYQEAMESERAAMKSMSNFPSELRTALLFLANMTKRGKVLDVCEDIFSYAKDRYFKGETVLSVIGNMWCPSRVLNVIPPTSDEFESYKKEQIESGDYEANDYLKDDSWGPPPDLFRYEVQELDPDADTKEVYVLEAIDVKREKTCLTRDKCRFLLKLSTYYNEHDLVWRVEEDISQQLCISNMTFEHLFVGKPPIFEESLGQPPKKKVTTEHESSKVKGDKQKHKNGTVDGKPKQKSSKQNQNGKLQSKHDGEVKSKSKSQNNSNHEKKKKEKKEKQLTPQELKQLEFEKRAQERENLKAQKKLIADFKKLWFKPKEDLEVEDLKDLPEPDPICCKIPNQLFGDFVMILEYFNCYSSVLKVRDCFPSGLTFDILERALLKNEIAGPLSDILQLLLRTIFRCQMSEDAEILQDESTAASVELGLDDISECASSADAIQQATTAATWSIMYQNTSIYKLTLDHLSLTEVLRLHLLSSGARPTEKDMKWRMQQRGGYSNSDDAGLQLRMEEPQILKALTNGTVFDLNLAERIKLIHCLINQVLTFVTVRDTIEESFEQFKQARINLRSLQATERRKENEDNVWKQKLKTEKRVPPADFMKNVSTEKKEPTNENAAENPQPQLNLKPELTEEQITNYLAKRDKEIVRRKQDYEWKASELSDMINKHDRKLGLHPIGRDRAFRRYWIFNTIPGLFVEDDDDTTGPCLVSPTPYYPDVNLEDLKFVEENYEKLRLDKDGSDKENSTSVTPKKVSKKKSISSENKITKPPEIFGICSGDSTTCKVHCSHSTKWYFYWDPDQLDKLVEGLSPRGIRENELRTTLKDEKSGIISVLKRCPVKKLNMEKHYPESITSVPERRPQRGAQPAAPKGALDPNLNFASGTSIEYILELQLRDLILETEEKIFLGALGSLKVNDRAEWRKAIELRSYDARTSTLKWGEGRSQVLETETLRMDDANAGSSKDNQEEQADPSTSPLVKSLACAILQLEQSVEAKFVKKPLGVEREDEKKKKSKSAEPEQVVSKAKWIQGSPLERWESSLLKCTNLSQLFVHLFTLDNSIEWTRSVLNARCRVCRRKGDSENMLLCDGCNKGHHSYCIKPPLHAIPKTDWFCSDCKPLEPEPRKRPPRNAYLSDEDIEDELNDSQSEDGSNSEGDSPGPANLEEEGGELEACAQCGYGGEVICCDNCPLVYHLQCLDPPKSRVPRGTWHCPECENPRKKKGGRPKNTNQKKKNIPKKPRRRLSSESESEEEDVEIDESESDTTPQDRDVKDNDEGDESNSDSDEKITSTPVVKMTFNTKKSLSQAAKSSDSNHVSSKRRLVIESDESEDEYDQSKRKSASLAIGKISQAVKRLRSDSKENDSSDHSNDSSSSTSHRRVRRHDDAHDSDDMDMPKRTRLQRMYTNKCGNSGDLDNVLLDKLIFDIMKQINAWPFLKPVTRNDAPDYHDIVKSPMDLGTIKYKLNSMVYTCNQEFFADLQQVFDNCFAYNGDGTPIRKAGQELLAYCERRCSSLGVHFSGSN